MIKKIATILFLGILTYCFGQQNDEFREVKKYFDYQKFILNKEFKKKFDEEVTEADKLNTKKDFQEFMIKLDSIQNSALVYALVKVKVREDLNNIRTNKSSITGSDFILKTDLSYNANYPGGFDSMRRQIADLFYNNAVLPDRNLIKTNLFFIVEKDGSISSVQADGDNFTFNRQAEIALYMLPEKFSPAVVKGTAVRYHFRLPLTMNFE
ncbi:hypothetical protein [Chryseobacterium sp. SNU WT5]|uniref:hypothetical protein n=1 Tax=Chryseobacterium sp. SNU WT5 TaxID=2594269 RepID=UPI001E5574E4|nr:hypothetical protein [Chryseobacterium sp. SNU WT5]